jgi:predicted negative regulator of RcsB-dependent stress response
VRSSTRHQLKTDEFRETTFETISWAVENRSKLIAAGIAVAVILAVVLGGWAYINYRNQQAKAELASALEKYNAPILPAGQTAPPGMLTYNSALDRAKAANADFSKIADQYGMTESGKMARYFVGITLRDMGDAAGAEKQLSEAASSRFNQNVAGLAKLALANLYQNTNQTPKAIAEYKDLIDHPTDSVGKWTAQFELAGLYQANNQPDDARKLYMDLQKESPTTPVGQIAMQRLQALGPAPGASAAPGTPMPAAPPAPQQ